MTTPKNMRNGLVSYVRDAQGVALIELRNPPANAYSHAMMRDLDDAILEARFDDQCHVIVLAGAGEKFFCAGADIAELNTMTPSFKYEFCLHANETLLRLENTPKLAIAALLGHCVGGGLEVAMAADIRVAARGSGKTGLPEIALGVLPGTGGTQRLIRLLGRSKALEMMVEGSLLDYDAAQTVGLVNQVWEREGFMKRVMEYAASFCPPNKASKSAGLIKRAVHGGADASIWEGLALERELQQQLFQSSDAKEGLLAYVEKRKAVFQGK